MSSDEDYSEDESPYLDAAVVVGSAFEFAQFQREVDFFASTNPSPEIIQHVKPVRQKPHVFPKRKTPTIRKPPNFQNIELLDAFTPENLTQDLLRCTNFPSPGPEYPEDYLYHLVGEYACALRLQAISLRWSKMHIRDWNAEVDLLLCATKKSGNGLTLWNVFDEALDDIKESMGNEGVIDNADGVTKRDITNKIKVAGAAKVKDLGEEMARLLGAKGVKIRIAKSFVKRVVVEDCEKNGALLLGTVPGFTNEWRRTCVTQAWSWRE
jgi:hypothetical protein